VAEWLGSALQKLLLRFESARDLDNRTPRTSGAFGISACSCPEIALKAVHEDHYCHVVYGDDLAQWLSPYVHDLSPGIVLDR
jgi:hypothetical protein